MTQKNSPYSQTTVRSNIAVYLIGRGFSAILTFTTFALAARLLNLKEYGVYAAALALMEIGLALSSAGIDWVAARVLPDYRIHASGRDTVRVAVKLCMIQSAILILAGLLTAISANILSWLLQVQDAVLAFQLAGALLAIEGIGRLSRDQMLGILMKQKSGQIAQLIRSGVLAVLLVIALYSGSVNNAEDILRFELIAASSALLMGTILLIAALRQLWPISTSTPDWKPSTKKQLFQLALHSYTSYLLALAYGPQVLTMILARILGVEAVAIFSFARGFADQVRRYLPTDLLQTIFRPALVAYFSATGSFSGLMLRLHLWLKVSLVVLLPLLVFFCVFGEQGAIILGGMRFRDAWPYIILLLCSAGLMGWRRIVELASYTVMKPEACVRAGMMLLMVPPLIAGSLILTESLMLTVTVTVLAEAFFCIRVMQILRQQGFIYQTKLKGFIRILFILLLLVSSLWLVRIIFEPQLIMAVVITVALSMISMRLISLLDEEELLLIAEWSPSIARLIGYKSKLMQQFS